MLLAYAGVAGSILLLTLGAELLVRGSVALATRMGVSSFFIGLTIVGFGTSTPELATSVTAAIQGQPGITLGNVVGSNICNIAFILGITALIAPIPVQSSIVTREVPLMILAAVAPYICLVSEGTLTRWMGISFLVILFFSLLSGYRKGRADHAASLELEKELVSEVEGKKGRLLRSLPLALLTCVAGLLLLIGSSTLLVQSSVMIARAWGVSELIIGLTIVALGTSAPELVTSVIAALRKQMDISVGNIVGSNLFNIFGIGGIAVIVKPQAVPEQALYLDIPVMIAVSLACLPIFWRHHRITRGEGGVLLASYVAYMLVLIFLAPGWFPAPAMQ